eukprot:2700442-Rhodomonas_salina.1
MAAVAHAGVSAGFTPCVSHGRAEAAGAGAAFGFSAGLPNAGALLPPPNGAGLPNAGADAPPDALPNAGADPPALKGLLAALPEAGTPKLNCCFAPPAALLTPKLMPPAAGAGELDAGAPKLIPFAAVLPAPATPPNPNDSAGPPAPGAAAAGLAPGFGVSQHGHLSVAEALFIVEHVPHRHSPSLGPNIAASDPAGP